MCAGDNDCAVQPFIADQGYCALPAPFCLPLQKDGADCQDKRQCASKQCTDGKCGTGKGAS